MTIEAFLTGSIFQFLLIFARVGAAVSLMPGFGEVYVAVRVRLSFALLLSFVLMPLVKDMIPVLPPEPAALGILILGEITIGIFFGLICRIILMATLTAGMTIALQMGIANALSSDPTTAQQGAVTGNFLVAVAIVLIFATGLDHLTLRALVGTYGLFEPGQMPPLQDVANMIARVTADSFLLAMQMSAPFLVYGLVLFVGMGLIARLMPTLQVFFVVMPLQLLVGFGLMAVTISAAMIWFLEVYRNHLTGFVE
ncbi:flagellar biosynthetic protein FliR [Dongia sp.]|uniref:flagellar biosynthetic protein FliR n=1 Tax=Dongia sp. TaxID=1977262 RepID=UPI0035AF93E3